MRLHSSASGIASAGLIAPSAGQIRFDGRPIHGLPAYRIAQLGLGYVPDDRRVFAGLTVRSNRATQPAAQPSVSGRSKRRNSPGEPNAVPAPHRPRRSA